jgi:hypothetical protein
VNRRIQIIHFKIAALLRKNLIKVFLLRKDFKNRKLKDRIKRNKLLKKTRLLKMSILNLI